MATKKAFKKDADKPAVNLIPGESLLGLGAVLGKGALKYSDPYNWRNGRGLEWSRVIASAMRHINAINSGQDYDPETGLPHAWHAMANCAFLGTYLVTKTGIDDRFSTRSKKKGKK